VQQAPIHPWELEQLSWGSIYPGFGIEVPLQRDRPRPTGMRPLLPGLDAWLRPFYGARGPVISPRTLRLPLHSLPPWHGIQLKPGILRYTFQAYDIGRMGNVDRIARQLRVHKVLRRHPLFSQATEIQAWRFFSLTPEAVGIMDWPQRVAKYLKHRQVPCYQKLALPPAATTR